MSDFHFDSNNLLVRWTFHSLRGHDIAFLIVFHIAGCPSLCELCADPTTCGTCNTEGTIAVSDNTGGCIGKGT